jgi:hypothetical protein
MNIVIEETEDILKNNNTAQANLISILENITKSTKELKIEEALYGDVDLSVIHESGYGNIRQIYFSDGKITSISNIPKELQILSCPNNLLQTLDSLPGSLEELHIPYNYLSKLDVSSLNKLQKLNVSHNQIRQMENLPDKIREFYIDGNKLTSLDLQELTDLNVLSISNNPITLIENLPDGVVDFKMENTPSIEFRNSVLPTGDKIDKPESDKTESNYIESLHEFFRLKNEYETKKHKMMRDAYRNEPTKKLGRLAALSVKPQCINCKRSVGTVFSNRDNSKYKAICGDSSNPCNLNIQIYNGACFNLPYLLNIYSEELEDVKDSIIRQKLDTLFNYVTEEKSISLFKKELENYNKDSKMHKELLDHYNELYNNNYKQEQIKKKSEEIQSLISKVHYLLEEYEKTENTEILKLAMTTQVNELYPEIRNMKLLKNEIMELLELKPDNYSVFQYPVLLKDIDYIPGQKPSVMKFQKN